MFGFSRFSSDMTAAVRDFLSAVPGAIKNHLNTEELFRITLTAVTAGGGVFGLLQACLLGVNAIFPAPTDAGLAATILTTILEVIRRLKHGNDLVPNTLRVNRPR